MKINEIIEKYWLKLEVRNGIEGIVPCKKVNPKDIELIKSNRDEIISELKARAEKTRQASEAAEIAKAEKEAANEALITSGEAQLVFIDDCSGFPFYEIAYIVKKDSDKYCTYIKKVAEIKNGKIIREKIGFSHDDIIGRFERDYRNALFPITKEQADEIIKIDAEVTASAARKKETAKAEREMAISNAKAEAEKTGVKVKIHTYNEPCNDPCEDCDVDNIVVYIMPDGTIKEERYHTW